MHNGVLVVLDGHLPNSRRLFCYACNTDVRQWQVDRLGNAISAKGATRATKD